MPLYDDATLRSLEEKDTLKGPKVNHIACTNCKCEYFQQIEAAKFDADAQVVLGQSGHKREVFHILKCLKCNTLQELPLIRVYGGYGGSDFKKYDQMIDSIKSDTGNKP
jgi:hypothetical protein